MKWYLYLIFLCSPYLLCGQGIFRLKENKPVTLKFELVNNVVLVPLRINGISFSFLLDTGVKETILFAQAHDSLYLHNKNKMVFHGIGLEDGIEGLLSRGNLVEVGNVAVDSLHWLYVIQASALDISTDVGVAINGILGSRFFQSFAVRMDYLAQQMTLYPPGYDYSKAMRKFKPVVLQIENDRPYLHAHMSMLKGNISGKMLLDMGNTDPLMVFDFMLPDFAVDSPFVEEYIGRGFNGEIHGKRNRIRDVLIGDFRLDYPIVSYPDSSAVFMGKLTQARIGSVGSQVLQRFDVLLDYSRQLVFLRKNKGFWRPFSLNMAGMDIKHDGMLWTKELSKTEKEKKESFGFHNRDQGVTVDLTNDNLQYKFVLRPRYVVSGIRKFSPAAVAGVRAGDVLLQVNGVTAGTLSLSKIMAKMQSKAGDILRLTMERDGKKEELRFKLVDPIPYGK